MMNLVKCQVNYHNTGKFIKYALLYTQENCKYYIDNSFIA
jgi:hypothetical protein